jgi:dTDP-L-rhamnose 4-epimerase
VSRALVTGGTGFLGSYLAAALRRAGFEVRTFDVNPPAPADRGRYEFLRGDVRDADAVRRALKGVDSVFHQAAFGGFTTDVSEYFDTNINGTVRIFEVILEDGLDIRKIVAASSQAIYGEGLYNCPVDGAVQPGMRPVEQLHREAWEATCPKCGQPLEAALTHERGAWNGETPYAVSKLAEERTVIAMGRQLGIPTVALRYAVTFGPRQSVFNPYTGVVSIFSTRMLNDLPPLVYEDGLQTRDLIFVEDVARANLLAMDDERADGGVFNVGRGEPVTVIELIEALAAAWDLPPVYELSGESGRKTATVTSTSARILAFELAACRTPNVTLVMRSAHPAPNVSRSTASG